MLLRTPMRVFVVLYVLPFSRHLSVRLMRPDRCPRHRSSDLRLRRSWSSAKRQPETVCSWRPGGHAAGDHRSSQREANRPGDSRWTSTC